MTYDVTITADGACWPNDGTGAGGWAFVLRRWPNGAPTVLEAFGAIPVSTNNVAELTAILEGLKSVNMPQGSLICLRSDSEYAIKCCTVWGDKWERRGWRKKGGPIKNLALIQAIRTEAKKYKVEWFWVKGHAGDADNERCDRLAAAQLPKANRQAMERMDAWRMSQRKPVAKIPLADSENLLPL